MGMSLVSGPASEPITTADAKDWLYVDTSDHDSLIDNCIKAARIYIEGRTRRALVAQTWDYTLKEFPYADDEIRLPLQPVTAVSYVHYVDSTGSTVSYADTSTSPETAYWTLITDRPYAVVIPNYNRTWPATRDHGNAVTVRFTAGYSTIPEDILQTLRLLVAHSYENREPVIIGQVVTKVELSVDALLSAYELRSF